MKSKQITQIEATYKHLCNVLTDLNDVSHELLSFCTDEDFKKFIGARSILTDLTLDVSIRLSTELKQILD